MARKCCLVSFADFGVRAGRMRKSMSIGVATKRSADLVM